MLSDGDDFLGGVGVDLDEVDAGGGEGDGGGGEARSGEVAAHDVVEAHGLAVGVVDGQREAVDADEGRRRLHTGDGDGVGVGGVGGGDAADEPGDIGVAEGIGGLVVGEVAPGGAVVVGVPVGVGGVDVGGAHDEVVLGSLDGDPEVAVGRDGEGGVEDDALPLEGLGALLTLGVDDGAGGVVAAEVDVDDDGDVVHVDVDSGEVVAVLQGCCGDPDAHAVGGEDVVTAGVVEGGAGIGEGVVLLEEGSAEEGLEGVVVGEQGVRVEDDAVAPAEEAEAGGWGGREGDGVAVGVGAAAGDGAPEGVGAGGDDGAGGGGAIEGVGLDADDGGLVVVEGKGVGVGEDEVAEAEEAVVESAVAPVEAEVAVGVVAVADELVAAGGACAAIEEGAAVVDLVLEEGCPLGVGVGGPDDAGECGGVFEVGAEGVLGAGGVEVVALIHDVVGGAAVLVGGAVVHIDGDAAVEEECGDGGEVGAVADGGEAGGHVGPVVGGGAEVGALVAEILAGVAVGAHACVGPLPVAHDLSHSGSHAAGEGFLAEVVGGAEVVVVGILVPFGLHEGAGGRGVDPLGGCACQQEGPLGMVGEGVVGGRREDEGVVAGEPGVEGGVGGAVGAEGVGAE